MGKVKIETLHKWYRKMWDELATTGKRSKLNTEAYEYARQHKSYEKAMIEACFACQAAGKNGCKNCPVEWDGEDCVVGEYGEWYNAGSVKGRKRWAAIIRDLPWKYEQKIAKKPEGA